MATVSRVVAVTDVVPLPKFPTSCPAVPSSDPTELIVKSPRLAMRTPPDVVFRKARFVTCVSIVCPLPIPVAATISTFVAVMFVSEAEFPSIPPLATISVASPPARWIEPAAPKMMSLPVERVTSFDADRVIALLSVIVPLLTFPMSSVAAMI